jgi:hypothetical protein
MAETNPGGERVTPLPEQPPIIAFERAESGIDQESVRVPLTGSQPSLRDSAIHRGGPLAARPTLPPADNKFHVGNGADGKHYWLTPPALMAELSAQYEFTFDPCPFPKPDDFDGLTCEWGESNYVNPPFGSIIHEGKKKGPTAWARKAIAENAKGKRVVLVYPIDKWVLMLLAAGARVENLGDVRWCATEDGSQGKGTGRHIAAFVLDAPDIAQADEEAV